MRNGNTTTRPVTQAVPLLRSRDPQPPVWARQLLRYACSCGLVLATKLALTWLLIQWLLPLLAYLLVHVVTFFVSYSLHSRFSFQAAYSWNKLRQYGTTVIAFKIIDYLLFAVLFTYWEIEALWAVLVASLMVMLLRFLVVRQVLQEGTSDSNVTARLDIPHPSTREVTDV